MEFFAMTDVGLRRASNQDAFCLARSSSGMEFFVLCDGMGGHKGGNVASELAVSAFRQLLSSGFYPEEHSKELKTRVSSVISLVNTLICNAAAEHEELSGMGSTVVLAVHCGDKVCIAHVGDSRAYLLRDGTLTRLTKDHSLVQDLLDRGEITSDQAKVHPFRHVITRVLGSENPADAEPELSVSDLREGDRFLLCSDGLTNVVDDSKIVQVLKESDPEDAVRVLTDLALDGGGPDNVTVGILYETANRGDKR